MDQRINVLETMLDKMTGQLAALDPRQDDQPTPCPSMTVGDLAEHLAVWMQVFAATTNDTPLDIDPLTHRVGPDRADVFAAAAAETVGGLRRSGHDRLMTMHGDQLPGELVLNMLLMEYVGHGWDLARATRSPLPYTEAEATVALDAAQAIIQPDYRGPELFDAEVAVASGAPAIDRLVGFLGRDPAWSAPMTVCEV
ncbi:MAG: TIGR03086 family metal-binding protein [Actinomycetota bacterium]